MHPIDDMTMNHIAFHETTLEVTRTAWITAFHEMATLVASLRTDFLIPVVTESTALPHQRHVPWRRPASIPSRWEGLWISRPSLVASGTKAVQRRRRHNPYEAKWNHMAPWNVTVWSDDISVWGLVTVADVKVRDLALLTRIFFYTQLQWIAYQPGFLCQWDSMTDQWMKIAQQDVSMAPWPDDPHTLVLHESRTAIDPTPLTPHDIMAPLTRFIEAGTVSPRPSWVDTLLYCGTDHTRR